MQETAPSCWHYLLACFRSHFPTTRLGVCSCCIHEIWVVHFEVSCPLHSSRTGPGMPTHLCIDMHISSQCRQVQLSTQSWLHMPFNACLLSKCLHGTETARCRHSILRRLTQPDPLVKAAAQGMLLHVHTCLRQEHLARHHRCLEQ